MCETFRQKIISDLISQIFDLKLFDWLYLDYSFQICFTCWKESDVSSRMKHGLDPYRRTFWRKIPMKSRLNRILYFMISEWRINLDRPRISRGNVRMMIDKVSNNPAIKLKICSNIWSRENKLVLFMWVGQLECNYRRQRIACIQIHIFSLVWMRINRRRVESFFFFTHSLWRSREERNKKERT